MPLYRAFGLIIASELCCPELPCAEGPADVEVRVAGSADAVGAPARVPIGFEAAPGHFELRVPRVGRFVVQDGATITITPDAGADDESLRLFLLGSAFGALLHQRGSLPLHGAAIWQDGRSVLILGTSGAGKSSLAAALGRHGWRLQSDDVSAVNLRGGRAECEPGFPRQKMWPDMLRQLGDDADRYGAVRAGLEKRSVPIDAAAFHDQPGVIGAVVVLGSYRGKTPVLARVDGPMRMALLKRLTFRANLRAPLEMHRAQFEIIGRLAGQAPVWRLQRPRSGGSPVALAETLLPILGSVTPT